MSKLDLNALTVLAAMLEHRNVTRAAEALGSSQPALSAALAKLRQAFDDPLFVRTARGMRPTARAIALAEPVHRVLHVVEHEIIGKPAFVPGRARKTFTIITPDIGELVFVPPLVAELERSAPGITLRSISLEPRQTEMALESGDADLAVGYFPELGGAGLYQQRLFTHDFVCVVRAAHPLAGKRLTLDQFLSASHVLVRPSGRTHVFEAFARKRGLKPSVRLWVSHFGSLISVLDASDLIATVPRHIASILARQAQIRLIEPPFKPPVIELRQHWHRRFHRDPANVWLRTCMRTLFQSAGQSRSTR